MIDMLNKTLQVNDTIVYKRGPAAVLYIGSIVRLTETSVVIKPDKSDTLKNVVSIKPEQLMVINKLVS